MAENLDQKSSKKEADIYVRRSFYCLLLLTILSVGWFLIVAKPVILPLVLALLITLVLRPIHKILCGLRMPRAVAAASVVFLAALALFSGVYYLSVPATEWGQTLDTDYIETRISEVLRPLKEVQEDIESMAEKVGEITEDEEESESLSGETTMTEGVESGLAEGNPLVEKETKIELEATTTGEGEGREKVVKVEVQQKATGVVLSYAQSFGVHVTATTLLIFFFLAYGDIFHRRASKSVAASEAFEAASQDVSSYLFTITTINFGLGWCIALAMWLLDMPNAILWGVMAMLLNYIPYLGALIGTIVVALVAIVSYSTYVDAIWVPLVYFGFTSLEGNVVTPMIIGKRFSLNPIVVVVWFLSWGAMWGVPGMLIATPTLMGFKIVCERLPSLERINYIISR